MSEQRKSDWNDPSKSKEKEDGLESAVFMEYWYCDEDELRLRLESPE